MRRVEADEGNGSLAISMHAAITEERSERAEPPVQLYDHIDAEAVGQLLAHSETRAQSEWELTFAVDGVDVTVTSEGEFTVE